MTIHPVPRANRTGARAPSPNDTAIPSGSPEAPGSEPEPPSTYLFTIVSFDELADAGDGSIGLSPPEGYHLQRWQAADEAVVVCWEKDDL